MAETHPLTAEISRLSAMERRIIDRFIHRQRVARDITAIPVSDTTSPANVASAIGLVSDATTVDPIRERR